MAWCKELVMAENRALFEIIDPTSGQTVDFSNEPDDHQEKSDIKIDFLKKHNDSTGLIMDVALSVIEVQEKLEQMGDQLKK